MKAWYSSDGKLRYIDDPSGNRVTCTYVNAPGTPAHGKLQTVQDAAGRTLTLTYNSQGRLPTPDP